jgi:hypothetical protein
MLPSQAPGQDISLMSRSERQAVWYVMCPPAYGGAQTSIPHIPTVSHLRMAYVAGVCGPHSPFAERRSDGSFGHGNRCGLHPHKRPAQQFFDKTRSISNAISSPTKVCPCLTLKSPSRNARATTYPQSVSCLNRRSSLMRGRLHRSFPMTQSTTGSSTPPGCDRRQKMREQITLTHDESTSPKTQFRLMRTNAAANA